MLYRTHVRHALEEKRKDFVSFERSLRGEVGELASRLRALAGRTAAEVRKESRARRARARRILRQRAPRRVAAQRHRNPLLETLRRRALRTHTALARDAGAGRRLR